jgi:cytoskeletal protein RodZ
MASYVPPDDPTVSGNGGGQAPEPDEPIPGWRTPIALVGWGVLIAILLGLIIWGIIQLAHGSPTPAPATTSTTTTTTTPTTTATATTTPTTGTPTTSTTPASGTDTGTPTSNSRSPGAFPHLPTAITLPPLPGIPTAITLPPLPGLPTAITLPPGL